MGQNNSRKHPVRVGTRRRRRRRRRRGGGNTTTAATTAAPPPPNTTANTVVVPPRCHHRLPAYVSVQKVRQWWTIGQLQHSRTRRGPRRGRHGRRGRPPEQYQDTSFKPGPHKHVGRRLVARCPLRMAFVDATSVRQSNTSFFVGDAKHAPRVAHLQRHSQSPRPAIQHVCFRPVHCIDGHSRDP